MLSADSSGSSHCPSAFRWSATVPGADNSSRAKAVEPPFGKVSTINQLNDGFALELMGQYFSHPAQLPDPA